LERKAVFERQEKQRDDLLGNYLCVDFVNTAYAKDAGVEDPLNGPPGLARWLGEAGVLSEKEAEEAARRWGEGPEGERVFRRAIGLRESLREMVEGIARGETVRQEAIEEVNGLLCERSGYIQVIRTGDGFEVRFVAEREEAIGAIVAVAESAAELLVVGDLSRIKKCENPECPAHFYDTSKNHSRRWCSMASCGNVMKARAYYRRHKTRP
jgi:predicted RNA-binding Zn ribbon-like protein